MKWLFITLVGLNLIVFAGMLANKMFKQHMPQLQQQSAVQQQPMVMPQPQIIINTGDLQNASAVRAAVASGNVQVQSGKRQTVAPTNAQKTTAANNRKNTTAHNKRTTPVPVRSITATANNEPAERLGTPRVQYKACSARVNMPEDDYHRIKGLLSRYPHAASRKIVQGGGEGNSQSSARMDVLFMSVNDQEASAIQGVVGRYGQLNRTPCNK